MTLVDAMELCRNPKKVNEAYSYTCVQVHVCTGQETVVDKKDCIHRYPALNSEFGVRLTSPYSTTNAKLKGLSPDR